MRRGQGTETYLSDGIGSPRTLLARASGKSLEVSCKANSRSSHVSSNGDGLSARGRTTIVSFLVKTYCLSSDAALADVRVSPARPIPEADWPSCRSKRSIETSVDRKPDESGCSAEKTVGRCTLLSKDGCV